jgi:prevent-host-death family protein
MQSVGVRDLKSRLTHYLRLVKEGEKVIVTDRGKPIALIRPLDGAEAHATIEERLAALPNKG